MEERETTWFSINWKSTTINHVFLLWKTWKVTKDHLKNKAVPCHSASSAVHGFQNYSWWFSKSPCFFQRNVLLGSVSKTAYLPALMFWGCFFAQYTVPRAEDLSRSRGKQTSQLPLVKAAMPECTQGSPQSALATPQLLFAIAVATLEALLRLQPWHCHSASTCVAQHQSARNPSDRRLCVVAGRQSG